MINKAIRIALSFPVFLVPALAAAESYPAGQTGPNIYWSGPPGTQKYTSVSQRIMPYNLGPTLYWSTQWFWHGAQNGGYAGFQTDGVRADNSRGPMAIFSVWDATEAKAGPGSSCMNFGGEGTGKSCRKPFSVIAGHTYRTDVSSQEEAGKVWWHATVTDETTGNIADLGSIATPAGTAMDVPSSFLEYFGPSKNCERSHVIKTDFEAPKLLPAGSTEPVSLSFKSGIPRSCALAEITTTATGVAMDTYTP